MVRLVKAARQMLDWSQEDLARLSAVNVATIRRMESMADPTGMANMRQETLQRLLRCFHMHGIDFKRTSDTYQVHLRSVTKESMFFDMMQNISRAPD